MIGSIIGDVIGSIWEGKEANSKDVDLFTEFSSFTDDTVMTLAVADSLLGQSDYQAEMIKYYIRYPDAGYGHMFKEWAKSSSPQPYKSYGNGSAMRVSPIGFAFDSEEKVLDESKKSAEMTHNSADGIAGAKAIAFSIFMALGGKSKEEIRQQVGKRFRFHIAESVEGLKAYNQENWVVIGTTVSESVPAALLCFLDSTDFEDTIRNALYLGGDTDTIACMAGGIAQAYYQEIPRWMVDETLSRLDSEQVKVIDQFNAKYQVKI